MENKMVVIYPGRFQPFHFGHKETYDNLVKKFGKDNVYIATSDKVELPKSPFNFTEKKKIITTMFKDIPSDHVVQVKNPYQATEITSEHPEDTAVIFAVGDKDADRLTTKNFFKLYKDDEDMNGYKDNGYVYITPPNKAEMSGTVVREIFSSTDEKEKEKMFVKLYGTLNKPILSLINKKLSSDNVNEQLNFLLEGGAYGHLSHFHDVKTNTFTDMKEFVDSLLQGKMEYARIKTDGMNLLFSFIDGRIRGARNSSDLKNFGKNSLTIDGMSKKFEGRDNVQNAYVLAMKDLQQAVKKIPREQIDKLFDNGKNWMSVEVMHPDTQNIIPYGVYELRFHGIKSYDENGKVTDDNTGAGPQLANMIKDIKANKQGTYEIKALEVAVMPPLPDFKALKAYFTNKITALQKEYGLKDSNTITDTFEKHFEMIIDKEAKLLKYKVPSNIMKGLVDRWSGNTKSFKVTDMKKIPHDAFRDWSISFDANKAEKELQTVANKFEHLTLEVGAVALKNLSTFMVVNPDKAVKDIKRGLDDVIKQVHTSNDPKLLDKMKYELGRLTAIGGMDAIAPEEGLTFIFKDNFYKITGAFAAVNQIMNLKYKLSKDGNTKDEV